MHSNDEPNSREVTYFQSPVSLCWLIISMCWVLFLSIPVQSTADEVTSPVPVSLEACIERALEKNLTIEQSLQKLVKRDEEIREVRATAYPQVEMEANYTYLGNLTEIDFGDGQKFSLVPEDNYYIKFMVSQLLYSGGQVSAALRLAEAARQAVQYEQDLTRETIIMLVSIYYYNAILMDGLVHVAEDTVATVSAHLDNVKVMKEQGLVSEFDLLRAEVELANIRPLLIRSRNQRSIAYARLADSIQWDGGSFTADGSFQEKRETYKEEQLVEAALKNRWELKIHATSQHMMKETIAIASGGYKPTVALFGNYDWANDEIDLMTGEGEWNYGWNVGLVANWKIFDGYSTSAKVAQASADLKITELEREKTIDAINLEIKEALNNYNEACELLDSQEKNVHQARQSLEIAEVRYKQGISTQLEVMDSRTALTRAQSEYVSALYNVTLADISVQKAQGILLENWNHRNSQQPGN